VSPALYGLIDRVRIKEVGHFDHNILSMVFVVDSIGLQHADTDLNYQCSDHLESNHESESVLRLIWKPDKALEYSLHIQHNLQLKKQFEAKVDQGDIERAYGCLKQLVIQAASDPRVSMSTRSYCGINRNSRRGMKRPVWFDWECQVRRQAFDAAVRSGEARHACRHLQRVSRSHARWARRRYTRHQRALFLARLSRNDAAVHSMLKMAKGAQRTPITAAAWEHYLRGHLQMELQQQQQQQQQERPGRSDISARDTAVPLGRKHPPPEVLLRQGEQSGWVQQPDYFNVPSVHGLFEIVISRLKRMNAGASPGLECIGPAFLKHACVPSVNSEGKPVKENVLAPLLSKLFKLWIDKSCIPADWKIAKLSPIHKKGPVLDPANYRMIAVNGTMYRLYTNVMSDLVTAWCKDRKKIPDTQFGFFPGRNTLQPMFILRHLKHAAQKLKPKGSTRPTWHSLILNRRMTLFQG